MKIKYSVFLFFFLCLSLSAQKIELKKGKVILDNKEIFSYTDKNRNTEFSLFDLNSNKEILFVIDYENETIGNRQDDYYKINFLSLKLKLESSNTQTSWKNFLKWLYENGIFDSEGKLNEEKIELFIEKYNENLTERTIR